MATASLSTFVPPSRSRQPSRNSITAGASTTLTLGQPFPYGLLSTMAQRRIANSCDVCKIATGTLIHKVCSRDWSVRDRKTKKQNRRTRRFETDIALANDGASNGGEGLFEATCRDVLTSRVGGLWELHRDEYGAVDGIWGLDADSVIPTRDKVYPFKQVPKDTAYSTILFHRDEIAQIVWHSVSAMGYERLSVSPIQAAYNSIMRLIAIDDYNWKMLTEFKGSGVLNLGESFNKTMAIEWMDKYESDNVGTNPDKLAVIWGTPQIQWVSFQKSLKELGFDTMTTWYASVITGAFEMSPYDLGITLGKSGTKANAESQERMSKRQGEAKLATSLRRLINFNILPPDLEMCWETNDQNERKIISLVNSGNAQAAAQIKGAGIFDKDSAARWLQKQGVFDDEDVVNAQESTDVPVNATQPKQLLKNAVRTVRRAIFDDGDKESAVRADLLFWIARAKPELRDSACSLLAKREYLAARNLCSDKPLRDALYQTVLADDVSDEDAEVMAVEFFTALDNVEGGSIATA